MQGWIPAFAGMTITTNAQIEVSTVDSRLRGNDVGMGAGMAVGGIYSLGAIRTGELGAILPIDQTEPIEELA